MPWDPFCTFASEGHDNQRDFRITNHDEVLKLRLTSKDLAGNSQLIRELLQEAATEDEKD